MKQIKGAQPYFLKNEITSISKDISHALINGSLSQGKKILEFEDNSKSTYNVKYAAAVNSCGTALEIILKSIGIKNQEVILPTQTFIATPFSVIKAGGIPVFADVNPNTLSLSMQSLKKAITKKTKVVILVHLFGIMSKEIIEIYNYCKKNKIYLVEDASHAHGAKIKNKIVGSIGDAAAFSFYATKIISCGEGGLITTNNKKIYNQVLQLRNYGRSLNNQLFTDISSNYRMSEIQSIIALSQQKNLSKNIKKRQKIAQYYYKRLNEIKQLTLIDTIPYSNNSYWRYPILISENLDKYKLQNFILEKANARVTWMYEPLCHQQPFFKKYKKYKMVNLDNSIKTLKNLINLPSHPNMNIADAKIISDSLIEFINKN